MKKIIFWLIWILIFLLIGREVYLQKEVYLSRYDPVFWQEKFNLSQWVKGWEAEEQMSDADLYAYAGWKIIKEGDPLKINPEQPPLGKYLIGLSILLFKNQNIGSLILGICFLVLVFMLAKEVLKDKILASLVVFLLALDKLFKENLITSMLDLPLAIFIVLGFYFFLKAKKSPHFYLGVMICLSLISLTKMYMLGIGLLITTGVYLSLLFIKEKKRDLLWFLSFLPVFFLVYFLFYLPYFINGHNLKDFAYYHFWVWKFGRVTVDNYPKGEIFQILFGGKWLTWWGEKKIIKIDQWTPIWTLSGISIFSTPFFLINRKNYEVMIILAGSVLLLGIFSLSVPFPRYLLPILPFLDILLCYDLKELLWRWRKRCFLK